MLIEKLGHLVKIKLIAISIASFKGILLKSFNVILYKEMVVTVRFS